MTKNISARTLCCKTERPLKYDICGQLISPDGFLHHRRSFEYNVLIAVTEGILHITSNDVPYSVAAGQYILLKAGELHFGHLPSADRLSYMWVHFSGELTPYEDNAEYPYIFPEHGNITRSEKISFLFHQLTELTLDENAISERMADLTLSLMLMELSREFLSSSTVNEKPLPQVVVSVAEWIRANYYKPFTVSFLANRFGYQADYLSSLFKKTTGTSIVRYTNEIRIRSAKNLLLNYDISIKEAAYSCGFSEEKYFMKMFKQYEGMTPTQYRNSFGRGSVNVISE